MATKRTEKQRLQDIEKSIRLAYDSLQSHLQYTYSSGLVRNETPRFHKKCCVDYATIIKTLCEQL